MKYKNTILIVKDMKTSKSFYKKILELKTLYEFHGYAKLSHGLVLQSYEIWKDLIRKNDEEIIIPHYSSELLFETEDIDTFIIKLDEYNIPLLHPLKKQAWGVRSVRFYDPDGHIIEVCETLRKVVKRSLTQGLTYEDIAKHTSLPLDYIKEICKNTTQ